MDTESSAGESETLKNLQSILEERIASHHIAGASIAIYDHGKIHCASAGFANTATGVTVDDRTIFQIGSTTKVLTATLIMMLRDQGKVELDKPVSTYLPELKIDNAIPPSSLTVRSLINYSAGIECDFFDDFGEDPTALAEYVAACKNIRFVHEPGKYRSYNSTSYCIAGHLIEKLTDLYFNEAMAEMLFNPLGIEDFSFYGPDVSKFRTAVGHIWNEKEQSFSLVEKVRMPHVLSPAGGSVTLSAKALLEIGLLHSRNGTSDGGEEIASEQGIVSMREPGAIVPPHDSELLIGWARFPTKGTSNKIPLTVASGATYSQNSLLAIAPEEEFAVSILANVDHGAELLFFDLGLPLLKEATGMVPEIKGGPGSLPNLNDVEPFPVDQEEFVGHYYNSAEVDVVLRSGELIMESRFGGTEEEPEQSGSAKLIPIEKDKFAVAELGTDAISSIVEFFRYEEGSDQVTHLYGLNRLYRKDVSA